MGAIYGGIIQSRVAYVNFMENNQATAFKSHLDAKVSIIVDNERKFNFSYMVGSFFVA